MRAGSRCSEQGHAHRARERATTPATTGTGGVELRAFTPGLYEVQTAGGKSRKFDIKSVPPPVSISGPWAVKFQPKRGAPDSTKLDTLASWTDSTDAGIKYFSGTAIYEKEFDLSTDLLGTGLAEVRG